MKKLNANVRTFIAVCIVGVLFFVLGAFYDVIRPVAEAALTRTKNYVAGTKILSADINFEFNALYGAIGTQTYTQKNQIANDQTTTASLDAIDMAIGTLHYSGASVVTSDQAITASILALDLKFGDWAFTGSNYIATTDNLTHALDALDDQVAVNTAAIAAAQYIPKYFKQNLKLYGPSSGTSLTQIQITADEIVLTNTSDSRILLSGVSEIVDMASSVTGLVTGAEAPSTLYYIYLNRYYSGTTTFAKLSTSGTTVTTLPPNTYSRLVGEVYNDASSNFVVMGRLNDRVTFLDPLTIFANTTLNQANGFKTFALPAPLSTLTATVYNVQALDLEANSVAVTAVACVMTISGTTMPTTQEWVAMNPSGSNLDTYGGIVGTDKNIRFLMPYNGTTNVYVTLARTGAVAGQGLYVWGYVLPR